MIEAKDNDKVLSFKVKLIMVLRDCLRAISMVSGLIIGFALSIALPYDGYIIVYLIILAILITVGSLIIKYKWLYRQNPAVDFSCAFIIGYVPPIPFMVLALWLVD
jgi:hypothetical protein